MLTLTPHPACGRAGITRFLARLARQGSQLQATYILQGDIAALALPPLENVRRGRELWRHTCFELFVRAPRDQAYVEYNFVPSGAWAAYRFVAYRADAADLELETPPRVQRSGDEQQLKYAVACELPADLAALPQLQANVTAVVESLAGDMSYWALAHPAERPDFHHAGGYVVELPR